MNNAYKSRDMVKYTVAQHLCYSDVQ
jgi:hypothetical protein